MSSDFPPLLLGRSLDSSNGDNIHIQRGVILGLSLQRCGHEYFQESGVPSYKSTHGQPILRSVIPNAARFTTSSNSIPSAFQYDTGSFNCLQFENIMLAAMRQYSKFPANKIPQLHAMIVFRKCILRL